MADTSCTRRGGRTESESEGQEVAYRSPAHLDLFSGIGGFALAAQWAGFRTIGFCEIDKYCQKVLAKNFLADTEHRRCTPKMPKHVQGAGSRSESSATGDLLPRIFGNIFDLDGTQFRGVSLITGGFPCQPFSVAGKRRGAADDRAIWPEMFRVIREARPAWVLGENVPGIIPMELDNVLSDLEGIGYACRPFVIPACAVDARHRRDRLWIIARNISDSAGGRREQRNTEPESSSGILRASISVPERDISNSDSDGWKQMPHGVAGEKDRSWPSIHEQERDADSAQSSSIPHIYEPGLEGGLQHEIVNPEGREKQGNGCASKCGDRGNRDGACIWLPEPDVGRVAHGIPCRVDRLKGLGNAIVPQVAYEILREIRNLIL